ncbi:RNA polymerase factor sigma-54 [Tepidibacter formicigenes]|jgi:RNA polymerase sigma-54 factor|uniref:RNA polymerase, sigma 54 subunit, RpoN/SigL n=1 Tax=Tepidibacter formicigenes DSM 15518 TaxID=1123349 RepID=A0A1M6MKW0_9FIRM|nr:RNA polymerase factor sigma-54 [Tepidibacter formicigenes]SHJ84054.1 RNA polymerase, sigma 54 subunit, RpoN/SigL [Tepidibacter formicigenes DSM 15518]
MKMNFGLELNQSQKLILTKQLKQSLDILNMNIYELEEVITKENEENPVIEVEKKEELDWEKYIEYLKNKRNKDREYIQYQDEDYNIENMIKYNISIYEYLKEQVNYYKIDKKNKEIVEYIIDCLDEDGYFRLDICEVSKQFGVSNETILKNLKIVQSLDPCGVGARNLEECLLIQIREKEINNNFLENIIKEDLKLLANKKYKDICKKYKIKLEECIKIVDIIKKLEPKPGRKYSSFKNNYIVPDVIVEKVGDKYEVYLNDTNIPGIKINKFYEEVLKNCKKDDEAKEYIKEKLNSAINLIRNIQNRKNTILKISKEILKHQIDFFENGNKYLKPLILKDIAESLDIHESTVSRGINGKYMLTPYGLFELKYFFSSGLKDGEDIASTSIKNIIKEIINSEDKKKPYSDSRICSLLKEKDINISRRTVAKYRDELGISSSSKRKDFY